MITLRRERLGLLWNTVRYLKPIQVIGRASFRLRKPVPELRVAPASRIPGGNWVKPAARRQSQTGPQAFRFLHRDGDLEGGWDDERFEKLWRYNLHYFDDLNAENAAVRFSWHEGLIKRWIAENLPAGGSGWEPYPTSLRIVNWIKWALGGGRLTNEALNSLAVQTRWLSCRLEYHLLGNHLFANAKALVFAGCFFEGEEAQRWLATGASILDREIREQILPDGGHFELSTMYHALALEDMLDLVNLSQAFPQAGAHWSDASEMLSERVDPMRRWLAAMCHPDGEIALFNDAAIGIAAAPAELQAYAHRLGFPGQAARATAHLQDSGYVRLEAGPAVAFFDAALIGPDYLPGHAHADTLTFEISVRGRRFLVNSGTSVYGLGPERLRQRGTAAHNTVIVAGKDSSEVWSGFRVARRARPFGFEMVVDGDGAMLSCSHDGYARLAGRPIHRRSFTLRPQGLTVWDTVYGGDYSAEARFHFHPDWTLDIEDGRGSAVSHAGDRIEWAAEFGEPRLEKCNYHPEFGLSIATTCLVVRLSSGQSIVQFNWLTALTG